MAEIDLRAIADEIRPESVIDVERRVRLIDVMTPPEYRDHVVRSARLGELYLWGVKVVIDNTANEIHCYGSATRGAQYRDDQPAGVDNSQQAAQGCRVAAGASERRADTCPLGTADSPLRPLFIPRAIFLKCARELGHDVDRLPSEGGQRYFDWVGGGVRYWEGHRTIPHGR